VYSSESMVYQGGEETGGRRVYVGNINYDTKEEELRSEFSEFGRITAISYKQGFAFIDYEDNNDASDAIRTKDGQTVWGRRISVELSKDAKALAEQGDRRPPPRRDNAPFTRARDPPPRNSSNGGPTKNLFVANIPEGITEADIQDHFSQYGPVAVVKFLPQKGDAKSGFVDFTHADDATRAHDAVNVVGGNKLRTDFNRPGQHSGGGGGGDRGGGYDRGGDYDRRDRDFDRDRDRERERDYDRREYDRREYDRREYDRREYDRYDDRRDYGRPDPYARERERDYDRRIDDRRIDDRRYDDYDRRDYGRPPPPRYDDRGYDDYDRRDDRRLLPPSRYEERRYDEPPPRRDYDDYDRRDYGRPPPGGPPPPRYDDRRYDERTFEPPRHNTADRRQYNGMREMGGGNLASSDDFAARP